MRNLVVCADGTWNTPDQEDDGVLAPTNVFKLYNSISAEDNSNKKQLKYYHPGVGTEGNMIAKALGGGAGKGLSKNIQSAYFWLSKEYQKGDQIFLFGFSRGAYTVRSLGGFISRCGLLDLSGLNPDEAWSRVDTAFTKGYREKPRTRAWAKDWSFHEGKLSDGHVGTHFIGVWDTVGALGIPDNMAILNLFDDRKDHQFHDVTLSASTKYARHAIAIDEKRESFLPTLWDEENSESDVKQVWFSGVHSDVGGGYAQEGLSDIALQWMIDEAESKGLKIDDSAREQIHPDAHGLMHDSYSGIFELMPSMPRNFPKLLSASKNVHKSVIERKNKPSIKQGPYRDHISLRKNSTKNILVYANQPWNTTNIYLEQGETYEFRAYGEWVDASIVCGPDGTNDGNFQPGELIHLAGSVLGKFEELIKKVSNNTQADLKGTRREEKFPWFSLVGAIADGGTVSLREKKIIPHTKFLIGSGKTIKLKKSGYFYCFANDAWNFYGNNRGSVSLEITKL